MLAAWRRAIAGGQRFTVDSRVRGNDGWRGGKLALSQGRLDLFVRHEQLPTPRERPVLESPEIFHPHEVGMVATGSMTMPLVRRAYLGTFCVRRIFMCPLLTILHAGGTDCVLTLPPELHPLSSSTRGACGDSNGNDQISY